jgi:PEP-CTERM motif
MQNSLRACSTLGGTGVASQRDYTRRAKMIDPVSLFSHFGAAIEKRRYGSSGVRAATRGIALVAAISVFTCAPASADTITFQDQAVGRYADDAVTLITGGVTTMFSGVGLRIRDLTELGFPPGSSRALTTTGDVEPITATFASGFTTDFVQIRNWLSGIYTDEVDTITMSAFDSSQALLGRVVSSNQFISLAVPGIAIVTFDDARHGDGYLIDDFTFRASPVPEPATILLVGAGVASLLSNRHRRRKWHI